MSEDLYDILGVKKDASQSEIKSAFKDLAKKNHPDKSGGNTEKMTKLNKAHQVLSDPVRRERYDSTGEEDVAPFLQRFIGLVNQVLMQMIGQATDVGRYDMVENFKSYLKEQIANAKQSKIDTTKQLKKLNNVRKRIKSKKDNTFTMVIDEHIKAQEKQLILLDEDIKFLQQAEDVLQEYNYDLDEMNSATNFGFLITSSI